VIGFSSPKDDCPSCPRLAEFRSANRKAWADWHNSPVPAFGDFDAEFLVVGLAPGLRGANRTGRPFTGDYAGDLLYATLLEFGLADGVYGASREDGLRLKNTRITNAVRCVPPENKPTTEEIKICNHFLALELSALSRLKVILALGTIAHGAVLSALGLRKSSAAFAHGAVHALPKGRHLIDSYHCSRYNTNTGRLTEAMFKAVFGEKILPHLHVAR
jgi:uracil-DNA glycosylase family 4